MGENHQYHEHHIRCRNINHSNDNNKNMGTDKYNNSNYYLKRKRICETRFLAYKSCIKSYGDNLMCSEFKRLSERIFECNFDE